MSKARKTVDTWEIWVNYGQGWEHDCTELSRAAMRENREAYRKNAPEHPVKIRMRRVAKDKLESFAPSRP